MFILQCFCVFVKYNVLNDMILHSRQAILTKNIKDEYYHYYDLYAKHSFFAESLVITICE